MAPANLRQKYGGKKIVQQDHHLLAFEELAREWARIYANAPWRLFAAENTATRDQAVRRCLEGLNRWLAEPIEECLALTKSGELCLEAKSPVDLELALGHYRGNIFQRALSFPFAETPEAAGTWGVETEFENVLFCGASARRGGGVSGIPGHNAAMKVLECLGLARR